MGRDHSVVAGPPASEEGYMPMDIQPFLQWAAPILSAIIVTVATASINAKIASSEKKRDEARTEREAEREAEREERAEWRDRVEQQLRKHGEFIAERDDWFEWRRRIGESYASINDKLDKIRDGTQTTMRTDLIHLYEKYTTRGWITPEEKSAWFDMHAKYSALDANGLIDSYKAKLEMLPEREI